MAADGTLRQERVTRRQLDLHQDAERRADDQGHKRQQHAQPWHAQTHAAPANEENDDANDEQEHRHAEDRAGRKIARQKGNNIHGYRHRHADGNATRMALEP